MGHQYKSKMPNENGDIEYTELEDQTWEKLIKRQLINIKNRCCNEYIRGLEILNLPLDRIPQPKEISAILKKETGWGVQVVPAIIPADEFFKLLANKKFPVASFIRIPEEFDYLEEPDIFHEIFGHCPLLTNQNYADFMQWYGELALSLSPKDRNRLFRLFWFTIEFGLIKQKEGYRAYGGGILSSPKETLHAIEGVDVIRKPLEAIEALRTPFRIDIVQPLYFCIEKFDDLFKLTQKDLKKLVDQSRELGSFDPLFSSKDEYQGDGHHAC